MILISNIIREAVDETLRSAQYERGLQEKELQNAMSPKAAQEKEQKSTQSATGKDDQEALKGAVDSDMIVEKINTLRSGKSLNDANIRNKFDQYFNSLSDAEKTAMFAFFKGVAQIVTGEVPAEQAIEPSDSPANVKMQKGPNKQEKHIQPNVIKKVAEPQSNVKSAGAENTAPPQRVAGPITPKKRST